MRLSRPIASRHVLHVGAHLSHRFATSLMNEILVARKAFEAYLISSADLDVGHENGAADREQRVDVLEIAIASSSSRADDDPVGPHEVFDRRAFAQELGVRRDGELVTAVLLRRSPRSARGADRHRGLRDDDLVAVHVLRDRLADLRRSTTGRRAVLLRGVPTAMKITSPALDGLEIRGERSRPACRSADQLLEARLVDRSLPFESSAIFVASLSTHVTSMPKSARHAPVTRPTYPVPTMQMFIWEEPPRWDPGDGDSTLQGPSRVGSGLQEDLQDSRA